MSVSEQHNLFICFSLHLKNQTWRNKNASYPTQAFILTLVIYKILYEKLLTTTGLFKLHQR